MPETYSDLLRDYLTVGIFGLLGAALVGLLLGVGSLLRPTRPQAEAGSSSLRDLTRRRLRGRRR